ncbi:MAG TPA: phosphate acetyltransferase [Burkholderiaceae bacterium]|nr:phosphate acetyltransferase [Burkholderiaceae bacterium]
MDILEQLTSRAQAGGKHIVLPEPTDPRVLKAGVRAARDNIATITLVGSTEAIRKAAQTAQVSLDPVTIVDPDDSPLASELAEALHQRRAHRGLTLEQAREQVRQPLHFANLMVHTDHADGSVAGAVLTTADVIRSALHIIGKAPASKLVSSFFLMVFNKSHHPIQGGMIFSDCALVINPNAEQLADIAISAAHSARQLLGETPRVAMLSFSSAGSAKHPHVEKVVQAARLAKAEWPDLAIDEDVQLDTALVPDIAIKKVPDSAVRGQSNVLIFPDLDAGNIGYKLAERLAGAHAIGPLLQGLNKPCNDLSRGCSTDDVYHVIAVTAVQAAARVNHQPETGSSVR